MQEIISYLILGIAVFYLIKKFFITSKKNDGCDPNCGCS